MAGGVSPYCFNLALKENGADDASIRYGDDAELTQGYVKALWDEY